MNKCEICGRELKNSPKWKNLCYDCWKKTELKGKKNIKELLKKYGSDLDGKN